MPMKSLKFSSRITVFTILFTVVFYFLHVSDFYNQRVIMADLGGVPWLYASLGTLFSIIAGFIMQKEWENWNNLVDAIKGEVETLRELWLWSRQFSTEFRCTFEKAIKDYLRSMIDFGLMQSERGKRNPNIEESLSAFYDTMFDTFQRYPEFAATTFSIYTKLISYRSQRIRYGAHHIPPSIRRMFLFSTSLMTFLSFFIGIKNIHLDYMFTLAVALLTFIIYLVIDDLDNPFTPGSWHVTNDDYKELLADMQQAPAKAGAFASVEDISHAS